MWHYQGTPSDPYISHFRTKGSKNGMRLYQYADGSLTPLGRKHYGVGPPRERGVNQNENMPDAEVSSHVKGLQKSFRKFVAKTAYDYRDVSSQAVDSFLKNNADAQALAKEVRHHVAKSYKRIAEAENDFRHDVNTTLEDYNKDTVEMYAALAGAAYTSHITGKNARPDTMGNLADMMDNYVYRDSDQGPQNSMSFFLQKDGYGNKHQISPLSILSEETSLKRQYTEAAKDVATKIFGSSGDLGKKLYGKSIEESIANLASSTYMRAPEHDDEFNFRMNMLRESYDVGWKFSDYGMQRAKLVEKYVDLTEKGAVVRFAAAIEKLGLSDRGFSDMTKKDWKALGELTNDDSDIRVSGASTKNTPKERAKKELSSARTKLNSAIAKAEKTGDWSKVNDLQELYELALMEYEDA